MLRQRLVLMVSTWYRHGYKRRPDHQQFVIFWDFCGHRQSGNYQRFAEYQSLRYERRNSLFFVFFGTFFLRSSHRNSPRRLASHGFGIKPGCDHQRKQCRRSRGLADQGSAILAGDNAISWLHRLGIFLRHSIRSGNPNQLYCRKFISLVYDFGRHWDHDSCPFVLIIECLGRSVIWQSYRLDWSSIVLWRDGSAGLCQFGFRVRNLRGCFCPRSWDRTLCGINPNGYQLCGEFNC